MITGFFGFPWFVWAGIALVIAVIYSFIWPQKAGRVTVGVRFFIIRWGHALVWGLIALNFLLRGISPFLNSVSSLLALVGGLLYLLFLMTSFVMK